MLNILFIKELFIGTIILLLGLLIVITISNGIGNFLIKFKVPGIIIILIHLFIIITGLYYIRSVLIKKISNKELFNSVLVLAGPTLAAASFYFSPIIKNTTRTILYYPSAKINQYYPLLYKQN